jgi:uncharacterized membrane protein
MSLSRILRHLSTSRLSARRAFPADTLDAIERSIHETETSHEGEIVFVVEAALDTLALLRGQTPRERAVELFSRLRVWDTERNNGVLIYVLLADHDVEIVADRGIDARAGGEAWRQACADMEAAFRRGDYRGGAVGGVRAVARHLVKHFGAPGARVDELPTRPIVS